MKFNTVTVLLFSLASSTAAQDITNIQELYSQVSSDVFNIPGIGQVAELARTAEVYPSKEVSTVMSHLSSILTKYGVTDEAMVESAVRSMSNEIVPNTHTDAKQTSVSSQTTSALSQSTAASTSGDKDSSASFNNKEIQLATTALMGFSVVLTAALFI